MTNRRVLVRQAFALISAVSGAIAAGSVWAQETTSQPSLTEIIVTAQKREQNIQDVPISVIALSAQQLQGRRGHGHQESTGVDPRTDRHVHHFGERHHRAHPRHRHGRRQSGIGILRRRRDRRSLSAPQRRRLRRPGRDRADRNPGGAAGRIVRQEQRRRRHQYRDQAALDDLRRHGGGDRRQLQRSGGRRLGHGTDRRHLRRAVLCGVPEERRLPRRRRRRGPQHRRQDQ